MPQQYMIESIDLQPCDMAAFVFDASNPESFHAAQDLLYRVTDSSNDTLPCILVAANNESGTLPVRYIAHAHTWGNPDISTCTIHTDVNVRRI